MARQNEGRGPSQRQLRVAEVIRRAVSDALMRGDVYDEALIGASITVGEVRCSPDLRHATVFVFPLGGQDVEQIIAALNENRREIRHIVTKSISLKYSPELKFLADTSFDQMDATRALFEREEVQRDLSSDAEDGQT
jgi:ribosome-binding factor A